MTCTGTTYQINPDASDEGVDVHHDGPCPDHPSLFPPITTVRMPFGAHDLDDMDIADPTIVSDELERVDVGFAGPLHGRYLRIEAPDLVDVAQALHRLADRIMDAAFDAREEKAEAERHDCICGTRIDPDETDCGALSCRQYAEAEARYDAMGLI